LIKESTTTSASLPWAASTVRTAAGDRFNAGVMLLLPDPTLYRWLVDCLARIQYDDAMLEQAYLNAALPYLPLPLEYNTMTLIAYAEPATWARVVPDIRILHFTVPKPHRSCSEYYMAHVCKVWEEAPISINAYWLSGKFQEQRDPMG
jgi:lipopolysaccharide biosynthesis glycosyltransferase